MAAVAAAVPGDEREGGEAAVLAKGGEQLLCGGCAVPAVAGVAGAAVKSWQGTASRLKRSSALTLVAPREGVTTGCDLTAGGKRCEHGHQPACKRIYWCCCLCASAAC